MVLHATWDDLRIHWKNLCIDHPILHSWTLTLGHAKTSLGATYYQTRQIRISRHTLQLGHNEALDTLLHEAAHAIVGRGHHHDDIWRACARTIGGTGERYGPPVYLPYTVFITCVSMEKCLDPWITGCYRKPTRMDKKKCIVCRKQIISLNTCPSPLHSYMLSA